MNLKEKIQKTLCFLRNDKYLVASSKLKKIENELILNIVSETAFLNHVNATLIDRIRYILSDTKEINKCLNCCKDILSLHLKYCSAKCNNNSDSTKNKFRDAFTALTDVEKSERVLKRASTFKERYGGYTFGSSILGNKVAQTMLNRYGVTHASKSEYIKAKMVSTWIRKYGVDNPRKAEYIKDKIKKVIFEKYGVQSGFDIDKVRNAAKRRNTKILHGLIIPDDFLTDYKLYKRRVRNETEQTYKHYKNIINPNNYERVTNGKNGYQLDHIYSVVEGFLNNIEPYILSHHCNLQMITWQENLSKHRRCDITIEVLKDKIQKYENKQK